MIQKGVAAIAVLALIVFIVAFVVPGSGQTNRTSSAFPSSSASTPAQAGRQTSAPATAPARPSSTAARQTAAPEPAAPSVQSGSQGGPVPGAETNPATANPSTNTDCFGADCDLPAPRIAIATPAPAAAPWLWQERVAWAANLVLVVLAYVAIMMGISLLRKIERQTRYAEEAAEAATESARATLKHAEAMERAERPWILMSVRPSQQIENGFIVVATNRGRTPARILSSVDEVVSAIDEAHLAATPVYKNEPAAPAEPIILLPGESTDLVSFSRTDVKQVCASEERLKRVENWEEKLYLYGMVTYRDLGAADDAPVHESSWFCWYIHGRQKSGMVMAGLPAYNRHS